MAHKKLFSLALFALVLFTNLIEKAECGSDDWELWTELRLKKPLTESVTLQGVISGRFRKDMGEFYKQFDEAGLSVKISSWLKMEGAYHFDYSERLNTQDGIYEHRPYAGLIPYAKCGVFDIENRNRLEYRDFNGVLADDWRYRNRTKASFLTGKDHWWEMRPFLSDEIFYGFNASEIQNNRFATGIEKPIIRNISIEIFYALESNKTGKDWNEFHALGAATTVTF